MDVINSTSHKVEQQVERFLPKKLAARRRWKRESFGSVASNEEQPRGRNREQPEYADEDQQSSDSHDTGTPSQSRDNLHEGDVLETLEEYSVDS